MIVLFNQCLENVCGNGGWANRLIGHESIDLDCRLWSIIQLLYNYTANIKQLIPHISSSKYYNHIPPIIREMLLSSVSTVTRKLHDSHYCHLCEVGERIIFSQKATKKRDITDLQQKRRSRHIFKHKNRYISSILITGPHFKDA